MRKILLLVIIILFSGCMIANTPTSKVEDFLSRYQKLDGDMNFAYSRLSGSVNVTDGIREDYREVIKKQYSNLAYEIKDEEIDGESAIVTAQVKVYNYKEVIERYDKNDYDDVEYQRIILNGLKDQKKKITYTIEFNLNMSKDGEWGISELSIENQEKLLGIN